MAGHRHFGPIRQHEFRVRPERLDETEDVVPATTIHANDEIPEFIKDFVHFECRENRFDQDGDPDLVGIHDTAGFGIVEDVCPQARFVPALQLGQVEIWSRSPLLQRTRVVEEVQTEVHEGGWHRRAL